MSEELSADEKFTVDRRGATSIEYGLIAALIAVAILSALALLGNSLDDMFKMIAESTTGLKWQPSPEEVLAFYGPWGNGDAIDLGELHAGFEGLCQPYWDSCPEGQELDDLFAAYDEDSSSGLEYDEWEVFAEDTR
ncbi:MAG: Flp family type IVb pilin [Proteobacteria bacterium]|nr:Flp family type IVb pilin [Pseudomonadota bacterium]